MMKRISGVELHQSSRRSATYEAEYRVGLFGVQYSGTITLEGREPSRLGGCMAWGMKSIPPGRAVERTIRELVQRLSVEKKNQLLIDGSIKRGTVLTLEL